MPIFKHRVEVGERFAIRGGNCNNDANCGRYVNLNNTATNTNWNIGAAVNSYHILILKCPLHSLPLGKNRLNEKQLLVASRTWLRG